MKRLTTLLLAAMLLLLPALTAPAHAQDGTITVWGLVVSTEFGLVIKDGSTDYLLLGVNDNASSLEGRTCEVTGTPGNALGIDTIEVESIQVIGDTSSLNYSMNLDRGGLAARLA